MRMQTAEVLGQCNRGPASRWSGTPEARTDVGKLHLTRGADVTERAVAAVLSSRRAGAGPSQRRRPARSCPAWVVAAAHRPTAASRDSAVVVLAESNLSLWAGVRLRAGDEPIVGVGSHSPMPRSMKVCAALPLRPIILSRSASHDGHRERHGHRRKQADPGIDPGDNREGNGLGDQRERHHQSGEYLGPQPGQAAQRAEDRVAPAVAVAPRRCATKASGLIVVGSVLQMLRCRKPRSAWRSSTAKAPFERMEKSADLFHACLQLPELFGSARMRTHLRPETRGGAEFGVLCAQQVGEQPGLGHVRVVCGGRRSRRADQSFTAGVVVRTMAYAGRISGELSRCSPIGLCHHSC